MKLKTILFDMDGIVIDSEKLHLQAMGMALDSFRIDYPDFILNDFVGRSDESFFEYVHEKINNSVSIDTLLNEKNKHFELLLQELEFVEGFPKFMSQVKEMGLKTALVTSSSQYSVDKANKLLDYIHFFDFVACEESTTKHKPHPAPYLLALENTKSDPSSSLVIEDSINGIMSGKAAGCIVAALTTSFASEVLLQAGADYVFDNYDQLAGELLP